MNSFNSRFETLISSQCSQRKCVYNICRLISWDDGGKEERTDERRNGGSMNNLIEAIDKEIGAPGQFS